MNLLPSRGSIVPVLFGVVIGANILTMSIANFFETRANYVAAIFLCSSAIFLLLIAKSGLSFPSLTKKDHLFCLAFGFVLCIPRLAYLFESPLGYSVNAACFDDIGHIQELASIIHSERFPPKSTFDESKYLSTYYAPWIISAALYWTGFLSTVKQALFLTSVIYTVFFVYGAVYASRIMFSERNSGQVFLAILFLYGGFDFLYWISGLNVVPSHSEWWATEFGFRLQFSNFFTLALWVPHHLISASATLYGLYVIRAARGPIAQLITGFCFLFATFSSVFVVAGAIPVIAWFFIERKLLRTVPVVLLTVVLFSLPLWWIYLGKAETGFQAFGALNDYWVSHKRAAFLVFLLILALELSPIIAAALIGARQNARMLWLLMICLSYLISTFFVAFSGANNYAMRGAIVPIFALIYLCVPVFQSWAQRFRPGIACLIFAPYLLGGVLEYASFSVTALYNLAQSKTEFNVAALKSNAGFERENMLQLVQRANEYPYGWYILEQFKPIKKDTLEEIDIELMNSDNRYRLTLSKLRHTNSK